MAGSVGVGRVDNWEMIEAPAIPEVYLSCLRTSMSPLSSLQLDMGHGEQHQVAEG